MSDTLMIIDASNKGAFEKITLHRIPGALPFAGKFRLIDFALSNAKNAFIKTVAIFPFGNYRSLGDHVGSGKRWDLDRKKDGLFILPPKHIHMPTETMLTFQRMHEHMEFFKRASNTYVFITPSTIVWNITIKDYVTIHAESGADISEIMHDDQRLNTFIMKRVDLLALIENYANLPYQTISEWIMNAASIDHHIIYHEGYTRYITDNFNYLKSNLAMLEFNIGRKIFAPSAPIVSKEKVAPPAMYLKTARVTNAMVASGSIIAGTVRNSIIGRDVTIEEGALIDHSVIMSGAKIAGDVQISHAIIDKNTHVEEGSFLEGTLRDPYVSQKDQRITKETPVNVLMVATESAPFVKTGGLGDVVNDLSRHLVLKGITTSVVMPLFKAIKDKVMDRLELLFTETIPFLEQDVRFNVYQMTFKGVHYYLIDAYPYFDRDALYGYKDDFERFSFFNLAVVTVFNRLDSFNLVHIHDWHGGYIPRLFKEREIPMKTILTLHNVNYQGDFTPASIPGAMDFLHREPVNFLESAIKEASIITTVSPTYKDELKYPYYGDNLTPVLLQRERDFYGILNGLSSRYSPENDTLIHTPYKANEWEKKAKNKAYLQRSSGLIEDPDAFIVGMVSRITETKGFPLILSILESFLNESRNAQFVLLGTGDPEITARLQTIAQKFPRRVRLNIGFDSSLPNFIYAGADLFLMPSRIEPCGLSQLIAMKYGTLPLVRLTGGLNDTVDSYDPITKRGTGFTFYHYDPTALWFTLKHACELYTTERDTYQSLQANAMQVDVSLDKQAERMIDIYHLAILKR